MSYAENMNHFNNMNFAETMNTEKKPMNPEMNQQANSQDPLFMGDMGVLPLETRRILVHLLSGPYLDGKRHNKLWPILKRDEDVIRQYLSELFLELIIDFDSEVAFIRQADIGDLEVPMLLRRSQLTFIHSVLLLYLRSKLSQASTQGERAVVSSEEIQEHLTLFEKDVNTDRAGFNKRVRAAIEKFKENNILQKIRATEDRYEISPALKLLFSAEEISSLIKLYQNMNQNTAGAEEHAPELEGSNGNEYDDEDLET